jgi:hypothetical protein
MNQNKKHNTLHKIFAHFHEQTDTSIHKNSAILSDSGKIQCAVASLLEEMRIR